MLGLHAAQDDNVENKGTFSNVIGTFEGKSGDGEVTNENGLDISTEVWKKVFDSDEFKYGIEHGYYIGYLGHPDDPGCQDFEHACIILRDGWIEDDGQVYAKVDLIDTPVGRIVKSFIDAGVEFGLSVRGAGDIVDNSVDPDTFCFRGFDLVAFPAYKDAIPTFTEIAASSKVEDVKKYKKICASVDNNIKDVNDVRSLEIIQSQFSKNSDEYKNIEKQIENVKSSKDVDDSVYEDKINGMMDLYLDAMKANEELKNKVDSLSKDLKRANRKIEASSKIYDDQVSNYEKKIDDLNSELKDSKKKYKICSSKLAEANDNVSNLKDKNLIYQRKIEKYQKDADKQDSVIASLQDEKLETVKSSKDNEAKVSNLDKQVAELQKDVDSTLALISDYQDAYSSLYASILGVNVDNISINNMTSVQELKKAISASTSVSRDDATSDIDEITSDYADDDMIVV